MAIKRRFNAFSGIRFDVPHLRSIESASAHDFDSVLRGLVTGTNQPYLIRGFDVRIPTAAIRPNALMVQVADSALLHASATEAGTILTIPPGAPDDILDSANPKVIGSFQAGVPNYISLDYRRVTDPATTDRVAAWSPSQSIEYQRTAPLGEALEYRYIINTSGFGQLLPLYIVGVDSNGFVEYITKATKSLFRLGTGGQVPDPYYQFEYKRLINPQTGNRREWLSANPLAPNPVTVYPLDDPNAFRYGDWAITSLKEWMDAVMSRFCELTGSSLWYVDASWDDGTGNLFNIWWDAAGSVMTGIGYVTYNYVLDSIPPLAGAYQSHALDNTIIPGDSYVLGEATRSRATLNSFNQNLLLINSLTSNFFQYFPTPETLYNRRLFRYNPLLWELVSWRDGVYTYGQLRRKPSTSAAFIDILNVSMSGDIITIETDGPHGFHSGQLVEIRDIDFPLDTQAELAVNRTQIILQTTDDTFTFKLSVTTSDTPALGGSPECRVDDQTQHPFATRFEITEWEWAGTNIKLTAPGHNISTGQSITVYGLDCTTDAPNGEYIVDLIEPDGTIWYTAGIEPSGTPTVLSTASVIPVWDSGLAPLVRHLTVLEATPTDYNVNNSETELFHNDGVSLTYVIGDAALPPLPPASGPIIFDGVVAISQVADPVRISEITYVAGDIQVTTFTNHNLTAASSTTATIFGDPSITPYARTYSNVNIVIDTPQQYRLVGIGMPDFGTYTNSDDADIFVHSPDNPYPGPIQWDSDIIVKGIIGDKSFTIPDTADADGTPLANSFNINGVHGTAYLQDGEVCYVQLERNQSVSGGAFFSCAGGAMPIIGATLPVDIHGEPLVVGDFVKFESDNEAKWLRISEILGTSIVVVTDRGLSPTSEQRPAQSGRLVYCKGSFDKVWVKPHWLVPSSPDIWWLAVRRDNQGPYSRVYFRSLELEVGETRQINDEAPNNLLIYTGARTESAINPNYTLIDSSGPYQYTQDLEISSIDVLTRMVTFEFGPDLGFQKSDVFTKDGATYTVEEVLSSRTIFVKESVAALTMGAGARYFRRNYRISDSDNLTLAIRKENRELGRLNTSLTKTIYDESVYCQLISVNAGADIYSGDYIYVGSQTAPDAIAWVLHGTADHIETIEGIDRTMPGGAFGSAILVHILKETDPPSHFVDGALLYQDGSGTRTINGNPPFTAPVLPQDLELVLPPNRRTQVIGSGSEYLVFPVHATYSASMDTVLTGESLLVISNDTIRQAGLDYEETFGGPKAKIRLIRPLPVNTRIRFRALNNFGSPITALTGATDLQTAYNLGNVILTAGSVRPVDIRAAGGDTALKVVGSIRVDGNAIGGIFPLIDLGMRIGSEALRPSHTWSAELHVKTHNSHPGSAWSSKTAGATTTSAVGLVVPFSNITVPANSVMRLTATAVARDSLNTGSASFRLEATIRREAGAAVLVGYPVTTINGADGDGLSYAATITVSGNDAVVQVFGLAGKTIEWAITEDYQIVSTSS